MKKNLLLLLLVAIAFVGKSQVFNTAGILNKGKISVGFEPSVVIYSGSHDFMSFIHGGVGLGRNLDLGVKCGVFGDHNYYGADVEMGISDELSLSLGMHDFNDFAVDATANVTIPLVSGTNLVTGLDMDYFVDNTEFAFWIPVGMRVGLGNGWSLMMEAEIELTDVAYHYFGFGMAYGF